MTPREEFEFERKAERELRGHRELPPGRDFRFNCFRFRDEDDDFRKRFDATFPGSPGSARWFDEKFGGDNQ